MSKHCSVSGSQCVIRWRETVKLLRRDGSLTFSLRKCHGGWEGPPVLCLQQVSWHKACMWCSTVAGRVGVEFKGVRPQWIILLFCMFFFIFIIYFLYTLRNFYLFFLLKDVHETKISYKSSESIHLLIYFYIFRHYISVTILVKRQFNKKKPINVFSTY